MVGHHGRALVGVQMVCNFSIQNILRTVPCHVGYSDLVQGFTSSKPDLAGDRLRIYQLFAMS